MWYTITSWTTVCYPRRCGSIVGPQQHHSATPVTILSIVYLLDAAIHGDHVIPTHVRVWFVCRRTFALGQCSLPRCQPPLCDSARLGYFLATPAPKSWFMIAVTMRYINVVISPSKIARSPCSLQPALYFYFPSFSIFGFPPRVFGRLVVGFVAVTRVYICACRNA